MTMSDRQYESRLDRKLDEYGDLTRAEEAVDFAYTMEAFHQVRGIAWLKDVIDVREGESPNERLNRMRGMLESAVHDT